MTVKKPFSKRVEKKLHEKKRQAGETKQKTHPHVQNADIRPSINKSF